MSNKFGSRTTALEAVEGYDLSGRQAVVTGGNSGIGVETIRALHHAGCDVVLCCRNPTQGDEVAKEITESNRESKAKVVVKQLDLADLKSVKTAADDILATCNKIDLLVLNAGVMACPLSRTKDGFEMQIGTNHIGHFYLTQLLLPRVKETAGAGSEARIVAVSSLAHTFGKIDIEDLNYEKRGYSSWGAYGQSKLANVLFARQLAKKMEEEGANVKVYSLHPGAIATNLQRHTKYVLWLLRIIPFFGKTVPQGASTTVVACTRPDIPSGSYLSDCQIAKTSKAGEDMDMAATLWELTENLVKEKTTTA